MRNRNLLLPLIAGGMLAGAHAHAAPALAEDLPPPPSIANHCGRDGPVTLYAIAGTHKPPPLPDDFTDQGREGNVDLNVIVGRDGKITQVTVFKSDAPLAMDEAAVYGVRYLWRWQPPPVECAEIGVQIQVRVAYRWYLGHEHLEILADDPRYPISMVDSGQGGSGVVEARISSAGVVVSAETSKSTKSPLLDDAMVKAVSQLKFPDDPNHKDKIRTEEIPVDFFPTRERVQEIADPLVESAVAKFPPPSAANDCGRKATVDLTPIWNAHMLPPYPAESQAAGEQGIVRMRVIVDKNGRISDASVTETNASPRLSGATVDFIRRYWRWVQTPAECHARGVQLYISQIWTMAPWYLKIYTNDSRYPAAARGKPLGAWGTVRVTVSETGDVSDPQIQTSAGSRELDASMIKAVMDLPTKPSVKDGKPQSAPAIFDVMFMPDSMQTFDTRPIPTRRRPYEWPALPAQ